MVENIAPRKVWDVLQTDPKARLVDVRTEAEWNHVGLPDLKAAGKEPALISWQLPPQMAVNADFVAQMRQAGFTPEHHIFFLCRSGVRSLAAAQAMQAAGFGHVYNIADGFEGPPDGQGQRGQVAGWQADGLPWRQR